MGRWRRSYSTSLPGWTDMTKALRIMGGFLSSVFAVKRPTPLPPGEGSEQIACLEDWIQRAVRVPTTTSLDDRAARPLKLTRCLTRSIATKFHVEVQGSHPLR